LCYFWAQMSARSSGFLLFLVFACMGCANITAPTGGKKDKIPPKLVSIDPKDSLLNTRIKRIEMHFDEYITVSDVGKEVSLSPILSVQPVVTGRNKTVVVKIVDSLLEDNTTYRLSFGKAIKDLHEGNPFANYTYTFSTGSYFDSLQLHGKVISAATGLPDSGNIWVELYYATDNDSAVSRHKPKYVVKADNTGSFTFKGLPKRTFRIYALKDANDNLIYDGAVQGESIAFADNTVIPFDTSQAAINLQLFAEVVDTAVKKVADTSQKRPIARMGKQSGSDKFTYAVALDTGNTEKRTFDITGGIVIQFSKKPVLNTDRITLSCDSNGVTLTKQVRFVADTAHPNVLKLYSDWLENTVYTLRLPKGFARDTGGIEAVPSRYHFRTQEDDDYGKIQVHLPSKYFGPGYVFKAYTTAGDSILQRPVTDTVINMTRLKPARYSFRVIVDKNHNGKWDPGDLFKKIQPEVVIPYNDVVNLKAGWENNIDFEPAKPEPKTKDAKLR
jgi:Bacterial Ig-like domain